MNSYDNALLREIYFANILMVDDGIGKILDKLQKAGLDENTWIFFCSDHGEMLGDHHMMYKLVFYESATKVPLIVRPPCPEVFPQGFPPHWISAGLTDHFDLTASILALAGLPTKTHGTSLLPKIANGPADSNAQKGKDFVISEIADKQVDDNDIAYHQLMLRTDTDKEKYKLNVELNSPNFKKIYYTVNKAVEFYNLTEDPNELDNIIQHTHIKQADKDVIAHMTGQINTLLKNTLTINTKGNGAPQTVL
jgi:arylsulfatase A-like enzyme